jgi:hypothetical protein
VNVLWGALNAAVGYALLFHVGSFDPRNVEHAGMAGLGVLVASLVLGWWFGRLHGGNASH